MKRNITVNIFGSLYPIDEDAYAMLNSYIINMRDYFSRQPDGKEIADDIEARVAELMAELRKNGVEAISIQHVQDIIERIGSPEQMGMEISENIESSDECAPDDEKNEEKSHVKRRLFRDPDHRILGGVCAGISCYLGINPMWLRLAAIILLIPTYGIIALLYIICWISIPLAITPAERLQMKGKPVNVSSLCNEFLNSTRDMISCNGSEGLSNGFINAMKSVLKGLLYAVCILLLLASFVAIVVLLIGIVSLLAAPWGDLSNILGVDFPLFQVYDSNPVWLLWVCGVSLLILVGMTLFLAMHFLLHLVGRINALNTPLRISCVAMWVITLIVFSASWTKMISNVSILHTEPYEKRVERVAIRNAKRKAEKKERELSYLRQAGWTIERGENVDSCFTDSGEHFSGDSSVRYLNAYGEGGMDMAYTVTRTLKVAPGRYIIKAAARTNGEGAGIFAVNGSGKKMFTPIPVCGSRGGSIWSDAKIALDADTAKTRPDRSYLKRIVKANEERGYGWSEVLISNITVGSDSILTYGVTNQTPMRMWEGTWLSASGFELIPDSTGK